jgi:hypothetical protein
MLVSSDEFQDILFGSLRRVGFKHIRLVHGGQNSSFVDKSGSGKYASEFQLGIKSNTEDTIEALADRVTAAMRELTADGSPYAGANVVAVRKAIDVIREPAHNLSNDAQYLFIISFYQNCEYYLLPNDEKFYIVDEEEPLEPAEDSMDFGSALKWLHVGARLARRSWKDISYILLVPGSPKLSVDPGRPLAKAGVPIGTEFSYAPHIDQFVENSGELPTFGPWVPTQPDILALDWYKL